jgi:hypothetical protein
VSDDSTFGVSRDRLQGTMFLLGLTLVVVGSAGSGVLGDVDVGVRLVGYGLALYAVVAYLRAHLFAWR